MNYRNVPKNLKGIARNCFRPLTAAMLVFAVVAAQVPTARALPTVSITSPANNAMLQGTVTLQATASVGTLGVQFKLGSCKLGSEDKFAPYTYNWDTTRNCNNTPNSTLNNVPYNLTAVARDITGTKISAAVTVKLNNPPLPGKVIVVGDSVTQQAFDPNADGVNTYTASAPGVVNVGFKQFSHMGWDVADVQATMEQHAVVRWPQKFVVAMGLNDAGTLFSDGWTVDDLNRFRTLINTVHPNACVAIVLPGHGATGATPWFSAWAAQIDEARVDLAGLVNERPHTMVFDWQDVINDHPEYVDEDGIHLLTPYTTPNEDLALAAQDQLAQVDPVAAAARQDFYWDAAAQCTL
jgi:hypothetical protein